MTNLIGTKLKEARKEKRLTQKQIAEIIHKTRETYCRYENGTLQPDIETLITIANAYKVSLDYLTGRYE